MHGEPYFVGIGQREPSRSSYHQVPGLSYQHPIAFLHRKGSVAFSTPWVEAAPGINPRFHL